MTAKCIRLSCEYLRQPMGVECPAPRLSWQIQAGSKAGGQSAYRILVADSPETLELNQGNFWDSGKIHSNASVQIPYAGHTLLSRSRCWWKVRAWDESRKMGPWSAPDWWEMGLLKDSDWQASWISGPPTKPVSSDTVEPSPLLRKGFSLSKGIARARLYVSGLGYHECYLNGGKVGDHVLDPAFSRYDKRVFYVVHDVTNDLFPGKNTMGTMLGNGWYNCHAKDVWDFEQAPWRERPKLLLQLEVEYLNGNIERIVSDTSWRVSPGPVIFDGIRNGESYDARREQSGWLSHSFDDSKWSPAWIVSPPGGLLQAQVMEPIRVTGSLKPLRIQKLRKDIHILDFGQNISGWVRLSLKGKKGQTVQLRYAERLGTDGDIDVSQISSMVKSGSFQTDRFTLRGDGREVWEPQFTYHGFRYVQVTGFPGVLNEESIRGQMVHTDLQTSGKFTCSNDLLNKIQACTRRATLTNWHGLPTDCPHREKNGWTGDAHLSVDQVHYNFHPGAAYTKWLRDLADAQRPSGAFPGIAPTSGWGYKAQFNGPAWDSAYILIPWAMYRYAGDTLVLREHYDGMRRYLNFLGRMESGRIVSFGLGDWCPPGRVAWESPVPVAMTSTAYYYECARIVAKIARILGKKTDLRAYSKLGAEIKTAFIQEFYDPATGEIAGGWQTAQAGALHLNLYRTEQGKRKILDRLLKAIEEKNGHLDCGILGTKWLLRALTDHGRADIAYAIATKREFPGWGHWIEQGATTLWETWDGKESLNHHMFGDISAWFFSALAGINPDDAEAGFKHVVIRPHFVGDLNWVKAEHQSPYGKIRSEWERNSNNVRMTLEIPPNSHATVKVPKATAWHLRSGGKRPRQTKPQPDRLNNGTGIELGPGLHVLTMPF